MSPINHPVVWLLAAALPVVAFAGAKHPVAKTSTYDRGVNETLDTIMWVEDQARREHAQLNWDQLNARVCREMNVRRTQPWERR